jgi:hypothetical protein
MATLSSARSTLLDLKVQVARAQRQKAAALLADPQADVTALDATIANLESQTVSQRHALLTFSGFANAAAAASVLPYAASQAFDPVPTQGSGNAVQSGGVFDSVQTKQDSLAQLDLDVASLDARTVTAPAGATLSGGMTGKVVQASQPHITSVGVQQRVNVTNALSVDGSTLTAGPQYVGVKTAAPAYPLDVQGNVDVSGAFRVDNVPALNATTLGANMVSSHLQTLGTLSAMSVSGNIAQSQGTANLQATTATSLAASGTLTAKGLRDTGYTIVGDVDANGSYPPSTSVGLAVCHNFVPNDRRVTFMNQDTSTSGLGGVNFRQRTASGTDFATNTSSYAHFARDRFLALGEPPILFREYTMNTQDGTVVVVTDVNHAFWHPTVAAVRLIEGDINELVQGTIYEAFFAPAAGGTWHFKVDFTSHFTHETAKAICMFVNKSMTGMTPNTTDSHLSGVTN